MKETMNTATVVMARCARSKQTFGIRTEKMRDGIWHCTWAFRLNEKAASNEGYGSTMISGQVALDREYPGCPYCNAATWFLCSCGKLTCNNGETHVTCRWCGNSGEIASCDTFDLQGGGY